MNRKRIAKAKVPVTLVVTKTEKQQALKAMEPGAKLAYAGHSAVRPGETLAGALRRHTAWLALAREQLDQGGDVVQTVRDLDTVVNELMTLSLEVEHIEDCERVENVLARARAS